MIIWVIFIPIALIALSFVAVFVASELRVFIRETRQAVKEAKDKETKDGRKGGDRKWR